MKANELRLNNYVIEEKGQISRITGIDDETRISTDLGFFPYTFIEEIQPIPLTEEWLLKSEHERKGKNIIIERFCLKWLPQYGYWYVTDESNGCYLTKLEFVHEWQNFYYVMQGEELTIK